CQQAQQCGLASAVAADDDEPLPALNGEREVSQHGWPTEALAEPIGPEDETATLARKRQLEREGTLPPRQVGRVRQLRAKPLDNMVQPLGASPQLRRLATHPVRLLLKLRHLRLCALSLGRRTLLGLRALALVR